MRRTLNLVFVLIGNIFGWNILFHSFLIFCLNFVTQCLEYGEKKVQRKIQ